MTDNLSNEEQIRTLVERWAKAIRDNNIEGVLAHHTDNVVMFDAIPPLQSQGMEAYKEAWGHFFDMSQGGDRAFNLRELKITAGDHVAFCHSLVDIEDFTVRLTLGLRKVAGEWLIAHEHHSAPGDVEEE